MCGQYKHLYMKNQTFSLLISLISSVSVSPSCISHSVCQDVQLYGRRPFLCHRGEHPNSGLHGDRLLDAVSPLRQLCPSGPVEVLHGQQVLYADSEYR